MRTLILLCGLSVPALALAQAVTETTAATLTTDPGAMLQGAAQAAQGGHWSILTGFVLMLMLWGVRKVVPALQAKLVPWAATLLALVGQVGYALATGADWQSAVTNGFLAGASAIGLWELVFQHFMAGQPKPAA